MSYLTDAEPESDPIVQAARLVDRLEMAMNDVTEMGERRIGRILLRARARLERREFAELDKCDPADIYSDLHDLPSLIDAHDDALSLLAERDAEIEELQRKNDEARRHIRALIGLVGFDQFYVGTDAYDVVHAARSFLNS